MIQEKGHVEIIKLLLEYDKDKPNSEEKVRLCIRINIMQSKKMLIQIINNYDLQRFKYNG